MTTFVWVIGCPRSGTTFLTRLLGMNTDLMFDEPETLPMYERYKVDSWKFPDCGSVVFKWCENFLVAEQILDRFPDSYFLHTIRDPSNTVYSIAFPKAASYPHRGFEEIDSGSIRERARGSIEKWHWYTENCLKVADVVAGRYLAIRYESMPDSYGDIEELTGIRLARKLEFRNRNVDESKLSELEPFWSEMPAAAELRRQVRQPSARL
jgi:hypothetical protein